MRPYACPRVIGRLTRARIEDQIEALITLLDAMDADPDFEPNMSTGAAYWSIAGNNDDREYDGADHDSGDMIFGGNERIRSHGARDNARDRENGKSIQEARKAVGLAGKKQ